jgi:2-amino-4-hydroxy-6-hydroxymethyldihydropteridine diphosphokinase
MNPVKAYISVGSNLGDKKENLDYAIANLGRCGILIQASPYLETEPVGYTEQPWFLNAAAEIETQLGPFELLRLCMDIEASRGRTREFPNAPRTLDMDILFYGNAIIRTSNLVIPHPRLADRKFVLAPMARIAPDLVHPVLRKSMRLLLKECTDPSRIRLCS